MKSHLFPVAAFVAALVLFSMTSLPAGPARAAEGAPESRGTARAPNFPDGKTFVAESGKKGKKASNKDTIVFHDGRFLSEGCTPWGFGDAAYKAGIEGAGIRFHAQTVSPTHGTMLWDGLVRGDAIEATSLWTRDRWYWKMKKEYWYRGQLKK